MTEHENARRRERPGWVAGLIAGTFVAFLLAVGIWITFGIAFSYALMAGFVCGATVCVASAAFEFVAEIVTAILEFFGAIFAAILAAFAAIFSIFS